MISPQGHPTSRDDEASKKLSFDLLHDQANRVARQFGVVHTLPEDLRALYLKFGIDLVQANGDDSWALPLPARFVIDRSSTIRSADADPDYTKRPEPARTVELLRTLRTRRSPVPYGG